MINNKIKPDEWPEGELEYLRCCPLCGDQSSKILLNNLTDILFLCAPGKWTLNKCDTCKAAYINPRPSLNSINLAYKNYYTHNQNIRLINDSLGFIQKIKRSFGNGYKNWRYGDSLEPSNPLGIFAAYLVPSLRRNIDVFYRFLPTKKNGNRVLDIGIGAGDFLKKAKELGWEVSGVDTDPIAVKNANEEGLNCKLGSIECFSEQIDSFDLITINHVIEHMHDPLSAIRTAYSLLKPGGKLWIDTPNIDSYGFERYGKDWIGVDCPRHLVIFGWETMSFVLQKAGFKSWEYIDQSSAALAIFPLSDLIKNRQSNETSPFNQKPSNYDKNAFIAKIKTKLNRKKSEFITLIARK